MTKSAKLFYDRTRILRELDRLSLQETLLVIGALYCASRKESPETIKTLVARSIKSSSQDFKDCIDELSCLEPPELRDLVKKLPPLYLH